MATLLLVHAHPDDESIFTGGLIAAAVAAGHVVTLLTMTLGERGRIAGRPDPVVPRTVAAIREAELRAACRVLGVTRLYLGGFHDSGFSDAARNPDPRALVNAQLDQVAALITRIVAEVQPDLVVTYSATGTYPHPDHVATHRAVAAALPDQAGVPVLGCVFSAIQARALAAATGRPGGGAFARPGAPGLERIDLSLDVSAHLDRKWEAFQAHRSQLAPGAFFLDVPREAFASVFGMEHFGLVRGELDSDQWKF